MTPALTDEMVAGMDDTAEFAHAELIEPTSAVTGD